MDIETLIDALYSEKRILTRQRNLDELEFSTERAQSINKLMERTIFDDEFIKALKANTPYAEIEKCYEFILSSILDRVPSVSCLRSKAFHVVVTGGIDLRNSVTGNDAIIVLEWPVIKYIDLLNANALQSKDFCAYRRECLKVLGVYLRKYKEAEQDVNLFATRHDNLDVEPTAYKIMAYLQQIQTIFMLGHELGHLLNQGPSGLQDELSADAAAYEILLDYCKNDTRIHAFIVIGVMLLFSYCTLLYVSMKSTKQEMIQCRDNWIERYEALMDRMRAIELRESDLELIAGYDAICSILDEICLETITSAE